MTRARTGAERYLAGRLRDPEYRVAYERASERISEIDTLIRVLDDRRTELQLTKAELARRAGIKPDAIRRLFSAEKPNPTLNTLVALTGVLDLTFRAEPRKIRTSATKELSASAGTRPRTRR
jgi:DNA-binding XRE family transcriptional regulator